MKLRVLARIFIRRGTDSAQCERLVSVARQPAAGFTPTLAITMASRRATFDRFMGYSELVTDIVLVDIVGFSKLRNEEQLTTVLRFSEKLTATIRRLLRIRGGNIADVLRGFIPTGDGIYVLLNEHYVGCGVALALSLRNTIVDYPTRRTPESIDVRIAVHTGVAVPFVDITEKENYVGDGMNDAARLLSLPIPVQEIVTTFARDRSFVVASSAAIARHDVTYGWWLKSELSEAASYRMSGKLTFEDKHGRLHEFVAVECDRGFVFTLPP